MAIALGISSPPVMAAVLGDLGLSRREVRARRDVDRDEQRRCRALLGIVVAGAGGAGAHC
jgi:hypothetical protein